MIRWDELVAEWRGRLALGRRALEKGEGAGVEGALLRMRVRVLAYLVARYGGAAAPRELEEDERADDDAVEQEAPPTGGRYRYFEYVAPPRPVEVSELHPPRSAAELRLHLKVLQERLPDRGGWWRWFWRGGWKV